MQLLMRHRDKRCHLLKLVIEKNLEKLERETLKRETLKNPENPKKDNFNTKL